MTTTTLKLWHNSIAATFTNLGALIVFAIVYLLLLLASYSFISTREATVGQVFVTYALMIVIPALFFIYQAAIIDHVRDGKFRWRAIVLDAMRFFLATVPLLLIAWLLYYLLNKLAVRYPAPSMALLPAPQGPPKPAPLHWPSLIFASLKFVLLGVALPLAGIHLWVEVASCNLRESLRGGVRLIINRLGRRFACAFGSESVLIYALGLIFFFVLPYTVLFVPFTPKGNKTDFAVFILRLLLTYMFSLIGWVVTVSALARVNPEPAPAAVVATAQPVEAAA
jgi:uncharacterized membrane protein